MTDQFLYMIFNLYINKVYIDVKINFPILVQANQTDSKYLV
jgi:hypothetical protein